MAKSEDKKLQVTAETIAYLNALPQEKLLELIGHTQPKEKLAQMRRWWWSFDSCPAGTDDF